MATLEEKEFEVEKAFTGIGEKLKPYKDDTAYEHKNGGIGDVTYLETPRFHVAVAKWLEHSWGKHPTTGIQWDGWLGVYFRERDARGIMEIKTPRITTRNRYSASRDRQDLWSYGLAGAVVIDENTVEASWMDTSGKKGPCYVISLEKGEVIKKNEGN